MPTFVDPVRPLIVASAQSSVMLEAPMMRPFPEQGPMSALSVVFAVMTLPHETVACEVVIVVVSVWVTDTVVVVG